MAPKKKQRRRRRRRVGLPRANRAADLRQSMGIPPTVRTVQGKTFREMLAAEKEATFMRRQPLRYSQTNEMLQLESVPKSTLSRHQSRKLDDYAARVYNKSVAPPAVVPAADGGGAAVGGGGRALDLSPAVSDDGAGSVLGKITDELASTREGNRAALIGGGGGGGSVYASRGTPGSSMRREREPWSTATSRRTMSYQDRRDAELRDAGISTRAREARRDRSYIAASILGDSPGYSAATGRPSRRSRSP